MIWICLESSFQNKLPNCISKHFKHFKHGWPPRRSWIFWRNADSTGERPRARVLLLKTLKTVSRFCLTVVNAYLRCYHYWRCSLQIKCCWQVLVHCIMGVNRAAWVNSLRSAKLSIFAACIATWRQIQDMFRPFLDRFFCESITWLWRQRFHCEGYSGFPVRLHGHVFEGHVLSMSLLKSWSHHVASGFNCFLSEFPCAGSYLIGCWKARRGREQLLNQHTFNTKGLHSDQRM